jgi:putative flippase GtrA
LIGRTRYNASMRHSLSAKFIGFAGAGAVATGIQYLILILLAEVGGLSPVYASAIGYAISAILNYLMKYHFVFVSEEKHIAAAPKYALISTVGLCLNTLLMYLGTEGLALHYLLVQIVTTGLVLVWNFFANAAWTFRALGSNGNP